MKLIVVKLNCKVFRVIACEYNLTRSYTHSLNSLYFIAYCKTSKR